MKEYTREQIIEAQLNENEELIEIYGDDYEGGEFVVAGEVYNPKKGSGIIFPSNFLYPHEVKPVIQGTRWSALTWLM